MGTYKSKPVKIEAIQFDGGNFGELAIFTDGRFFPVDEEDRDDDPEIVAQVLDVLHSTWVGVKVDQYIIKGTKGEFYPCDPEVFREKYERV
jgi:hypothetical protein